jgi:hypothetical protein
MNQTPKIATEQSDHMAEITANFQQLLAADKQVFPPQELLSENLPLNTSLDNAAEP